MTHLFLTNRVKKFVSLNIARIVGSGAVFLLLAQIARLLDLDALGQFAIYVSLANFYAAFASGGLNNIGVLFTSEYRSRNEMGHISGFIGTAIKRVVQIFFASLLVGFVCCYLLDLSPEDSKFMIGFGAFLTGTAIAIMNVSGSVMVGLGKPFRGMVSDALMRPVLTMTLVSGAALLLPSDQFTLMLIIALSTCAAMISAVVSIFATRELYSIMRSHNGEHECFRWNRAALPWIPQSLLSDYYVDIFLLISATLLASPELAVLHVCLRLRAIAGFGLRTIYMIYLPEIASARNSVDSQSLDRKLNMGNINAVAFSASALALFALFGDQILQLFNIAKTEQFMVLLIIISVLFMKSIFGPYAFVLSMHGYHSGSLVIAMIGSAGGILGTYLLVPYMGLLGAALGYTVSLTLICFVGWMYCLRKTGINTALKKAPLPGSNSLKAGMPR